MVDITPAPQTHLCLCFLPGRHVHRELHQHHRRGLQDQDYRAGREDHKASDCKRTQRHRAVNWWVQISGECSDWRALLCFLSGTRPDRSGSAPSHPVTTEEPTASSWFTTWRTRSVFVQSWSRPTDTESNAFKTQLRADTAWLYPHTRGCDVWLTAETTQMCSVVLLHSHSDTSAGVFILVDIKSLFKCCAGCFRGGTWDCKVFRW